MKKIEMKEKGITLIALVITIIVLLILAGVTIATLMGNNGILTKAQQAKTETEEAEEDELRKLTALEASTNLENYPYTDKNGDIATIPVGFAVSQVEGENIIDSGLVVIDSNGNEFVWIPVDGILGEDGKTVQNVLNGEIILGRYVFDNNGNIDTTLTPTTLGEELKTNSESSYGFFEKSIGNGNMVANDINGFIDSVRTNGGYYIARFEASQGLNGKAESKYNKTVWKNITQQNAAIACQDLYEGVNSDLVNSYAWDTAILFIQKYSGDEDYSRQVRLQNDLANTGKATDGKNYDVRCNIYDMAGNLVEWTTETSGNTSAPCVYRGGIYDSEYYYTSIRGDNTTTHTGYAFRSFLYL